MRSTSPDHTTFPGPPECKKAGQWLVAEMKIPLTGRQVGGLFRVVVPGLPTGVVPP